MVVVGSSSPRPLSSDSHILICIAAAALKDEKKKNDVGARATAAAASPWTDGRVGGQRAA